MLKFAISTLAIFSSLFGMGTINYIHTNSYNNDDISVAESFIDESAYKVEEKITSFEENTFDGKESDKLNLIHKIHKSEYEINSGISLNFLDAQILETNDGYKMLRIPFEDTNSILDISGVSFYFDESGNLLSYGEVLFKEKTPTSGSITFWQDGKYIIHKEVAQPSSGKSNTQLASYNQNKNLMQTAGFNWKTFNDCLSQQGIASWAIAAIGVACGAACAATAGIGCIICATSVAGITGGTIGHCAGKAML